MAKAETHSLAIHLSVERSEPGIVDWTNTASMWQERITNHSPQLIVRIFPVAIQWIEGT